MTQTDPPLNFPSHLSAPRRRLLEEVAACNAARHGEDLLAMVLSGSAGRGVATERSDVDVYIVLADGALGQRVTLRSESVDEIPLSVSELDELPAFGSDGWWYRWSFAWAPILMDRSGGRVAAAVRRQATVDATEAESVLVEHDRLDGWLNYAYRALKNHRDGRTLERRLDAAESMPWLLDVIFSLSGRVRPYHKYLPWELRTHPLPDWDADELLGLLVATLDGDAEAIRTTFTRVVSLCSAFDTRLPEPVLQPIIDGWGGELEILRG